MANADSTLQETHKKLLAALGRLIEAEAMAHFVQSISLNGPADMEVTMQPKQLLGFFYAMENTINKINEAKALIEAVRKQPETLGA